LSTKAAPDTRSADDEARRGARSRQVLRGAGVQRHVMICRGGQHAGIDVEPETASRTSLALQHVDVVAGKDNAVVGNGASSTRAAVELAIDSPAEKPPLEVLQKREAITTSTISSAGSTPPAISAEHDGRVSSSGFRARAESSSAAVTMLSARQETATTWGTAERAG